MFNKGWLVTGQLNQGMRSHFQGLVARSAVTPRHHTSPVALRVQMPDQRNDQRRLACAASDHIADHNHGDRESLGPE